MNVSQPDICLWERRKNSGTARTSLKYTGPAPARIFRLGTTSLPLPGRDSDDLDALTVILML
jgi:hypothetical protein